MELNISSSTRKIARKYELTPEELVYADLVSLGWTKNDAYTAAYRPGITWSAQAIKQEIDNLTKSKQVKQRIKANKLLSTPVTDIDEVESTKENSKKGLFERATSKEDKIIELQRMLEENRSDAGTWLKINQQIIDLTRMKQDEVKTEDNTRHYHLPVNYPTSCKNCLLNPALRKKEQPSLP